MEQHNAEQGTELVLDNRRLILGFLLLIIVCGAFFVIGFMEGKRQAIQVRVGDMPPSTSSPTAPEAKGAPDSNASGTATGTVPSTERAAHEQLDWYKHIQSSETESRNPTAPKEPEKNARPPQEKKPASAQPTATPPASSTSPATTAPKATYSVQVGAFRQRLQAEAEANSLKQKGFSCTIEPPTANDELFRVKVGKFESRADAVAMERKLTKAGFHCIIKLN